MAERPRFDDVEWILRTDTAGVRVNTLGPGQATPWHRHTEVVDDVFCLETPVEIGLRAPDETVALAPGQRLRIPAGRVHRVANPAAAAARYLLVQVGRYDFDAVEAQGAGAAPPPPRARRPVPKGIDAAWHRANPMPRGARMDERIRWHLAHAKACGCRKIPASVAAAMRALARGASRPAARERRRPRR